MNRLVGHGSPFVDLGHDRRVGDAHVGHGLPECSDPREELHHVQRLHVQGFGPLDNIDDAIPIRHGHLAFATQSDQLIVDLVVVVEGGHAVMYRVCGPEGVVYDHVTVTRSAHGHLIEDQVLQPHAVRVGVTFERTGRAVQVHGVREFEGDVPKLLGVRDALRRVDAPHVDAQDVRHPGVVLLHPFPTVLGSGQPFLGRVVVEGIDLPHHSDTSRNGPTQRSSAPLR